MELIMIVITIDVVGSTAAKIKGVLYIYASLCGQSMSKADAVAAAAVAIVVTVFNGFSPIWFFFFFFEKIVISTPSYTHARTHN